jgi:hypothetical protein
VLGRTTNYSRTIDTLRGVLTGLYPASSPAAAGQHAPTFPVVAVEDLDEILYSNVKSCERLEALVQEMSRQAKGDSGNPSFEIQQLQRRVCAALKLPADTTVNFLDLHDALTTMRTHGKEGLIPAGNGNAGGC